MLSGTLMKHEKKKSLSTLKITKPKPTLLSLLSRKTAPKKQPWAFLRKEVGKACNISSFGLNK